MNSITLHKKMGQHFLKDKHIAEKIVKIIEIQDNDWILEIGPGDGVLTQFLINTPAQKIIAVEIDHRFTQLLREKFNQAENLDIIGEDFLVFAENFFNTLDRKIHVIANLPYYITTPILFTLLDYRSKLLTSVVTIQKEVADRLISSPDTKTYGIPSVFFTISKNSFFPVPKVDSAVVKIKFLEKPFYALENERFFRIMLKKLFGQRRKMIKNTLKTIIPEMESFTTLSVDITRRPENLTVKQFVHLCNELYGLYKEKDHDRSR
ncbi:MAG: 16S rRNA (adenine(1518)-N(6)/adenine(1519)-N(6))-dimethyltransferase RsmA [bacterium]